MIAAVLIAIHIASVIGLALYGALGFLTLALYWHHRRQQPPASPSLPASLPTVTVQLPVFNEREVVEGLIAAAAALEYPPACLEIQVLDDSTDDTTSLAAASVDYFRRTTGLDIKLLHRNNRLGFKAGALTNGLGEARGEFIAVFDADFLPQRDFLLKTVPHLVADERLGAVQARWEHLNADDSPLTGAQAIALDKHFAIEQFVRHRAGYFPKFNGSAGIWRRDCIEASGGWHWDTVCEDMCLSTRAVLAGWRLHFADDVAAPAELPTTILAYKSQQARWAMGTTQCLAKYAAPIWRARQFSLAARLYALLSMSAYMTQALLLLLILVQLPLLLSGHYPPPRLQILSLMGLGQPILFVLAQQVLHRDWSRRLVHLPSLLLIAIGTAPSNTRAVVQALTSKRFTFARTPKGAAGTYSTPVDATLFYEMTLALYCAFGVGLAWQQGNMGPVSLLSTALLGFAYTAVQTLREANLPRRELTPHA